MIANQKFSYWIDHTDNAVIMDIFTFGNYGGIFLGPSTYGQFTNFGFDCVTTGLHISSYKDWEIAQGCIFAYVGEAVDKIHPIIIDGAKGHTSLTNIDCVTAPNNWIKNCQDASYDFLYLPGEGFVTVSMLGCKMSGYVADDPVTVDNSYATLSISGCFDKNGNIYQKNIDPTDLYESGTKTMLDACDSPDGWTSQLGSVSIDKDEKKEGEGCVSVTGKGVVLFMKKFDPVQANVSNKHGHLHLWLYISDISGIDSGKVGSIEISSSGTCDENELSWSFPTASLKSGWNELDLRCINAGITGGYPDRSAINYFRIYHHGVTKDITIKIDDIYFYQE